MKMILTVGHYRFKWTLLALHLLYFSLLLWVYTTFIVDIYQYTSIPNSLSINKIIISIIFIIISFSFLRDNGLPSFFYLNLILALGISPSFVIFSGGDLPFLFAITVFFAFLVVAITVRIIKLRRLRLKYIDTNKLLYFFAILSLLFIFSIFAFGGGRFINFDIMRVYDFRSEAASNLPSIYSYLSPNFSKIIIPLGIVFSFIYRKRMLLLIFIFCAVMIFALTSNKSPLFIPFAIVFTYWVSNFSKKEDLTIMALIMVVLIGAVTYYLKLSGIQRLWGWFGALFIYRTLIIPSLLDWYHFEFFSSNPVYYWADSKFSLGLITRPYDIPMQYLIGREYFGSEHIAANTGWIGSGMGNAGYWGILLYSILFGLFLSLIDVYAKKLDKRVILAICLIPVTTIARSCDFSSMFLTQGLFALLFVLIFLGGDINQKITRSLVDKRSELGNVF